jgi:hypothetical protein
MFRISRPAPLVFLTRFQDLQDLQDFFGWPLRGRIELRMSCFAGAYVADFPLRGRICRGLG